MFATLIADCLKNGRAVRFRAPGRSMHPTIREDEAVVVAPIASPFLSIGDIVLSRYGEKITAHRLVWIDAETAAGQMSAGPEGRPMYILRGDACTACDAPVPAEQILGKVVAVERRGRIVNPYGRRVELVRRLYALASRLKSRLSSVF
jgi:signal peptidase I